MTPNLADPVAYFQEMRRSEPSCACWLGFDPLPLCAGRDNLRVALLRGLGSPIPHERNNCGSALTSLFRSDEIEEDIRALLRAPGPARLEAIRAAGNLVLTVEPELLDLAKEGARDERRAAIHALGNYPSPMSRATLRTVVEIHCQRTQNEYEAPPQCGGSARDYFAARAQFDLVAECAVGSLAEHQCTDDLPLLFDALRRGDPIVRQKAAESLAYQFPADESVRDVLCAQYELEPASMKTILFGLINDMDRIAALDSKEE